MRIMRSIEAGLANDVGAATAGENSLWTGGSVPELTIICEPYPNGACRETVVHGVDQHNVASTGLAAYYPVGFVMRGARGEVLGGLLGDIWGGWMFVGSLWVDPSLRGRGFGAVLMARAHHYALEKSCTHSHLRTGSYEARPFYEKLGYTVYAELKDHPIAQIGRASCRERVLRLV